MSLLFLGKQIGVDHVTVGKKYEVYMMTGAVKFIILGFRNITNLCSIKLKLSKSMIQSGKAITMDEN